MEKVKLPGETQKQELISRGKDRLYNFILDQGNIRGALIHATRMIREMKINHHLGILETLALGHAYIAAGLMTASLKGNDRVAIQIECDGPIKGLVVESNSFGEIRGYLKQVPIPIDKPVESFDLKPFLGQGILSVTKYLDDAKHPFTGKIEMTDGSIARDLTRYFLKSEQIPSSISLSVKFDQNGEVAGAGGLFLQALPGAKENTVVVLEQMVLDLPSLGEYFADNGDAETFINTQFELLSPKILHNYRTEFMCHCNNDKILHMFSLLPYDDLHDMAKNGPFPIEVVCHYCSTRYRVPKDRMHTIFSMKFPAESI